MRKFPFIIVLFLILLRTTGVSPANNSKSIRIGFFQNPPIVFQNNEGEPQGLYIDLLNEIAARENWKIIYVFDSWSNNISKIKSDQIDLLSSIAFTPDRSEFLDFSKETIWTFWGVVYARKEFQIQSVIDLEGLDIAIMNRGIFGKNFRKLCNEFNVKCNFRETTSQDQSLHLLATGEVDAAIFNNTYRLGKIEVENVQKTPVIFSPLKAYVASKRGKNKQLLATIDYYIKKWKDDRDSPYYKFIYKWTGQTKIFKKIIPPWVKLYLPASIILLFVILLWAVTLTYQIRKRQAMEKKLREDEKKFRYLSEAAFEGIVISEKGKILEANSAMGKMFGYSIQELLSLHATDLITPEERENVKNKILSEFEGIYESTGLQKDGSTFAIEVRGKMFANNEQKSGRITAVRDISQHKKDQEELQKNIKELQKMLAELKTLRGILPICASCKKIRDDKGYWNRVETYIEEHSDAQFSHGLCEECSEILYRDQKWFKGKKTSR